MLDELKTINSYIDNKINLNIDKLKFIFHVLIIIFTISSILFIFTLGLLYGEVNRTEEISQIINNSANNNHILKFTCTEFIYSDKCVIGNYYITNLNTNIGD